MADYVCLHDEAARLHPAPGAVRPRGHLEAQDVHRLHRPCRCWCPFSRRASWCTSSPTIAEIRAYCAGQVDLLWDEVKRFENPHNYYVDLSQTLWDVRGEDLLKQH